MTITPSRTKFIYITGCDTGFGSIVTRKLDNLGFGVISGVYLQDSIEKIKKDCSKYVYPIQVDVSDEQSVENAAKEIKKIVEENNGVLHGIINNAGILVQPGPTEWTPYEAYRRMFNVNVMGTVMTTKSLLPLLRQSKGQGRIVNVASIAGRVGLPTEPAYCMSKYGVEGYSEVLRKDMYSWGITVHIIEPGVFKATGLYDRFYTGLDELWANLDPEIKADYGEEYFQKVKFGMKQALNQGSAESHLVPEAMVEAMTSPNPKYRYKVGFDSKYAISFLEKCHESVQDGIFGAWKAGNIPAGAIKGAHEMAYSRYHKAWGRFFLGVGASLLVARQLKASL